MPPWPGGPCPVCGDVMPERLIHCRNCRAMLNSDLESDTIEIPAFIPLQEIASHVELDVRGYFVPCSSCERELRINAKYAGKRSPASTVRADSGLASTTPVSSKACRCTCIARNAMSGCDFLPSTWEPRLRAKPARNSWWSRNRNSLRSPPSNGQFRTVAETASRWR